ncbi:MAG TPA: rRNA adenine dimethyltransferase family protein [Actinomycetota bacterium]|nr:rRNA adenine dimethyltransferase family protein [Actinomycetota bacterium]
MGARGRAPRPRGGRADGQHFLRSPRLAAELVRETGVGAHDLVVEIGAGSGALTLPLSGCARRVIAVELDPRCVAHLRTAFAGAGAVEVIQANALAVPLPREPYRVVGNLPFSSGTRILRRLLDDPAGDLVALDAILQFEAARKRGSVWPGTLATLGWRPWWDSALVRRIPRGAFAPAPAVDAGVLRVRRRPAPLLPPARRPAFVRMLAAAFALPHRPVGAAVRSAVTPAAWRRLAAERGFAVDARPPDLDVSDWVAVFEARSRGRRPR